MRRIIIILALLLLALMFVDRRSRRLLSKKLIVSGWLALLALFCVHGFWTANELSGSRELLLKGTYACLGIVAVVGAVREATKGQ